VEGPECLVVHPGALGDVLVARPALADLGALGFRRTLAAAPRLADLLVGLGAVEAGVDLDALGLHRLFAPGGAAGALEPLRRYDAVVSWLGAGDADFAARLAALRRPVVVARATPPPGARRPAWAHLRDTVARLGAPARGEDLPPLRPDAEAREWAAEWLAARGLAPGQAVVLHPGAGSPAKAWPGFGALAARLAAAGRPVVLTAGPGDRLPRAEAGGRGGPERVARDLPLRRLAGLLAAARGFVGNDSGPTHLAAALGVPTVAVFGPTDPGVWAPVGRRVRVVAGPGPGGADPWSGVTPERVAAALGAAAGPPAPAG
jgi:ADP-heptose:LPS heptosyltransferase